MCCILLFSLVCLETVFLCKPSRPGVYYVAQRLALFTAILLPLVPEL